MQEAENTLVLEVGGARLSFFGGLDFGRGGEPQATDDGILQVASPEDLMATKVVAILQRISAKDYRDIAAMISSGVSLARGLSIARAMRGKAFQPMESLRALTYFHGADLATLTRAEKRTLIEAAKGVHDLPRTTLRSRALSSHGFPREASHVIDKTT